MNAVSIVQARMSSERLPGKVLTDICGRPMLWHIVQRARGSRKAGEVVVATSRESSDDEVKDFANAYGIPCYRGSLDNVLERYFFCACEYGADVVVRLTGDNALIDPEFIDGAVGTLQDRPDVDYVYFREGLPLGMAVEAFKFSALEKAHAEAENQECLEHVTPYIHRNPEKFFVLRVPADGDDYSHLRWTMDTPEDRELILKIYGELYEKKKDFRYRDVLDAYKSHEEWIKINSRVRQKRAAYEGEASRQVRGDACGEQKSFKRI